MLFVQLTSEDLPAIDNPTEQAMRGLLGSDAFGKFVVLSKTEHSFIQAGCDWQPTDECSEFLRTRDSDPWILEYHDGETDQHFRANGHRTLNEVIDVFALYLVHDDSWRTTVVWSEVRV